MKKVMCVILLVLCMGTMYYFSSQEGSVSKGQSDSAVRLIDKVRNEVTLKDEKLITLKEKVFNKLRVYDKGFVVRKMAHFSIYALIGVSMTLVIYVFSKKIILSGSLAFILTAMYAYYDEHLQLSVAGRVGSLKDVFIDCSGAATGILILVTLVIMGKGVKGIFSLGKKNKC